MSFVHSSWLLTTTFVLLLSKPSLAFTGSQYALDTEYSGTNFFDGWDFYSDRDPTGGTVTYYSRSSAELTGLISTSESGPAYMGANYVNTLPFDNSTGSVSGAGRPSIRIASKQAWTHGLFIGDFHHIPAGVCGTWPAFWTLGPNWPFTGEIDILEGVNLNTGNVMSLHTNETCTIQGNPSVMTGTLGNTNCAYYPDYNVGCGVADPDPMSYNEFNQAQGGVYAMQWTSEYIRIWRWPRSQVPSDVNNKVPDPSSWGLPIAQLGVGNCTIDQHFQDHKVIFDLTFCGAYAGLPSVWNSNDAHSCAAYTGLATCDNYVANNPRAFKNAYWSVNYVRVYQLVDPNATTTATPYIASLQPTTTRAIASNVVATPNINAADLCPHYNYTIITDGTYQYEIACDVDVPGPDLVGDPYHGFHANNLTDCLKGCSYFNTHNGTNVCGGVIHYAAINFCYFKKYFDQPGKYRPGYNEVRLIYYGYPQVTDNIASRLADSTATTTFVEIIPVPQTYRGTNPPSITASNTSGSSTSVFTSVSTTNVGAPAMGLNSTSFASTSGVGPNYSKTVTSGYTSVTSSSNPMSSTGITTVTSKNEESSSQTISSTQPTVSTAENAADGYFYITFQVSASRMMLSKRTIQYLSFDQNGQSQLVSSESEATRFNLDADGSLVTSTTPPQYVYIDSTAEYTSFSKQNTKPDATITVDINADGSVVLSDISSYCLNPDGTIELVTPDCDPPDDCQSISLQIISSPPNATSSGVSTSHQTSTSTAVVTTISTPTGSPIDNFIYSGCFGIPNTFNPVSGIAAPFSNAQMTNELCISHCKTTTTVTYFAGTYNDTCFCASTIDLYPVLIDYPDPSCTIPCPGANQETCGGSTSTSAAPTKRSLSERQNALLLISLYNNTDLVFQPSQSSTSVSTTLTGANASPPSSTIRGISSRALTSPPTSLSFVNGGIPTSFPASEVSYNVTGTNTATVLSTTYVDICNVCPGGLTTLATTITIPHFGCNLPTPAMGDYSFDQVSQTGAVPIPELVPGPTIPMMTTIKQCSCGDKGASSKVTLTLPCETSIAAMISFASAAAGLNAGAGVGAGLVTSHAPSHGIDMVNTLAEVAVGAVSAATGVAAVQSMPATGGNRTITPPSITGATLPAGIATYVSSAAMFGVSAKASVFGTSLGVSGCVLYVLGLGLSVAVFVLG